jgi:hypothetical protein
MKSRLRHEDSASHHVRSTELGSTGAADKWSSDYDMAVRNYIDVHKQNPKRFIWTAKASDIPQKVTRPQASQ